MACLFLVLVLVAGCSTSAGMIEALGKDPASVCVQITSIYGTMRLARTNIVNGNVSCVQEGLTVQSDAQKIGAPAPPK
jgi:lipopolysaccharide export system protein LptA